MRIAVLGPEGTFCDKAFEEYRANCGQKELTPVYFPTVDEVFAAVGESCELGIAPIENTLDGFVQRTLDLLLERPVHIIGENKVPVHFSLVGNVKSREEIKKLYVQFKANGQCRSFINSISPEQIISTNSNMESFYAIGDEPGAAAIVPYHILEKAGDRFTEEDVTDADSNFTRFVIFAPGEVPVEFLTADLIHPYLSGTQGEVHMPVFIIPAVDRPGVLYMILRSFYENQINMVSIMSRPTKHELGTYNFFIEIKAQFNRLDKLTDTLNQIHVYNDMKILGVYDSV